MRELTEEEKRALRGSKFAPLPSVPPPIRSQPREAHPGGPMKTNKAAALGKFLERKLQEPNGLATVNPELVELAVKNAKQTVLLSGTSASGRIIHHVDTFDNFEDSVTEEKMEDRQSTSVSKKLNQKRKMKKKKKKNLYKKKKPDESTCNTSKRPRKKLKL